MQPSKRYLIILAATTLSLVAGIVTHRLAATGVLADLRSGNLFTTCKPEGLNDTNFIAGCSAPLFGDYEHGAYYFGLEGAAVAHLRRAEVLVLGNSKAMFAFSTRATEDAFRRLGVPYYLLGFGYGESQLFPLALIKKYGLRPKALIINADPFFEEATQFQDVLEGDWATYLSYVARKYFYRLQEFACSRDGAEGLLCGKQRTIYRSAIDGRWETANFANNRSSGAIDAWQDRGLTELPRFRAAALRFRAQVAVPDRCIIVTVTPALRAWRAVAQTIAEALGATYVVLPFEGFHTIDGVHLTPEDAERWSAEVLQRADAVLRGCLQG